MHGIMARAATHVVIKPSLASAPHILDEDSVTSFPLRDQSSAEELRIVGRRGNQFWAMEDEAMEDEAMEDEAIKQWTTR